MPVLDLYDDRIQKVCALVSEMAIPNKTSRAPFYEDQFSEENCKRHEFRKKLSYYLYLEEQDNLNSKEDYNKIYARHINELCQYNAFLMAPILMFNGSFIEEINKAFSFVPMAVGLIVNQMVVFNENGINHAGKNRASQYILDHLKKPEIKLSRSTLDAGWGKFKTVSHLWAAFGELSGIEDDKVDSLQLVVLHYEKFLGYAMFYQDFLLHYESSNNRKFDINEDNLVLIPDNIGIEPIRPPNLDITKEKKTKIIKWCNDEYHKKYK